MNCKSKINAEQSEDYSNDERKPWMLCKPENKNLEFWENKKIVDGAQKSPEKSKLWTDNSLKVAPFL